MLTLLAKMFAVGYIGIASAIFIGYAVWLIITEAPFFLIGLIAGSGIGGAWLFVFMFGAKAYWEYWEEQSKKRSK